MNDLRDLVNILDGLCIENTGFMIVEAHFLKWGTSLIDGEFWNLKVQGYCKELADPNSEDPVSILTLVERIENKYNEKKWKVLKVEELEVEELEENMYNLTIKKYQEDSKNEENNDPEGEQVEAEK